jgi:sugar (pentulose or hexulose) kinase
MAGREYEIIAGGSGEGAAASPGDVAKIVRAGIMALPTFAPGTGPFANATGRWSHDAARLSPAERAGVAGLYAALVAETCLALTGAAGPVIVEGPFARNTLFLAALAQRLGRPVIGHEDATGTIHGAALLAAGPHPSAILPADPSATQPLAVDLGAYATLWRERIGAGY